MSVFVPVEPRTDFPLPHVTWNPDYGKLLRAFSEHVNAAGVMPQVVSYKTLEDAGGRVTEAGDSIWVADRISPNEKTYEKTYHLPLDFVPEPLLGDMMVLAEDFMDWELPEGGAVIPVGILDDLPGTTGWHFFTWLRSAVLEIAGDPSAAHNGPTDNTGRHVGVNDFPPHMDMWIPSMLFVSFNRTVAAEGYSTLLPVEKLWGVCRDAGMPTQYQEELRRTIAGAGRVDYYKQFNHVLYRHPWGGRVNKLLFERSYTAHLTRGQGYTCDDRSWLHGRTGFDGSKMNPGDCHRFYRIAYNNRRLSAEIMERGDS